MPTDANIKVTGPRQVTWIPNSAPPPSPNVLYVVPAFAWRREVDEHGILSSWRRGGGLRVYLDRGWNASGYGEMLGVVLPPKGFADDPDAAPAGAPYKKYVTLWGNDPIWDSAFVPGVAPTLANFPLARTAPDATGAWLPPSAPPDENDQRPGVFACSSLPTSGLQIRGGAVDVAPHDVFYDETRQLWYCDVEIATGAAYFPFIRLALARYQPTSSPGAHLSAIVLSDIIAVAPDRWINVTPASDTRTARVALFGVGYDESSGHREASKAPSSVRIDPVTSLIEMVAPAPVSGRTVVEVSLERFDPSWGEDFGWQRVDNALVTQRVPAAATKGLAGVTAPIAIWHCRRGGCSRKGDDAYLTSDATHAKQHHRPLVTVEHALGGGCRAARRRLALSTGRGRVRGIPGRRQPTLRHDADPERETNRFCGACRAGVSRERPPRAASPRGSTAYCFTLAGRGSHHPGSPHCAR